MIVGVGLRAVIAFMLIKTVIVGVGLRAVIAFMLIKTVIVCGQLKP